MTPQSIGRIKDEPPRYTLNLLSVESVLTIHLTDPLVQFQVSLVLAHFPYVDANPIPASSEVNAFSCHVFETSDGEDFARIQLKRKCCATRRIHIHNI